MKRQKYYKLEPNCGMFDADCEHLDIGLYFYDKDEDEYIYIKSVTIRNDEYLDFVMELIEID